MPTLAESAYLDSVPGALYELPSAGTALENPYAYDAAARELKAFASQGLLRIVAEHTEALADDELISRVTFERLR
jgi:hypothetical protein